MENVPGVAVLVKVRCSGKSSRMGYLRGCVITLNVWFYKVTRTGKKMCFGKTPRPLCYGQNSYRKQAGAFALVDSLEGSKISNYFTYVVYELFIEVVISGL